MNTTFVIVLAIIAVVVIVFVLRDRITELSVDGREAKLKAKMDAQTPQVEDEKPTSVVFKGNKIRGEGEYRIRNANFSENDVDGKQKLDLGYDDLPSDAPAKDNK